MPNSFVWIGLVVVWIFVLFPMVTGRRSPVRRTGEATLATRVLHRGGVTRPARRGPAAGHAGDPHWRPTEEQRRARLRKPEDQDTARAEAQMDTGTTRADDADPAEEILDAEVVADAAAAEEQDPGVHTTEAQAPDAQAGEAQAGEAPREAEAPERDGTEPDGAEQSTAEQDSAGQDTAVVAQAPPRRRGRGGFDPQADAIASAARYRTRQRAVLGLAGGAVAAAVLAFLVTSLFWWVAVLAVAGLGVYLTYLRRQVRLEQEIRRRRMARLQKSRTQAHADRRTRATVPGRPRRSGVVVLEADDEDPAFEHLPHYTDAATEPLRRASGQ